jgi:hypothetical protein
MTLVRHCAMLGLVGLATNFAGAAEAQFLGMESYVGSPQVDYSADMVMEGGGQLVKGRVYRSGNKERREIEDQGESVVIIIRLDTRTAYVIAPQLQGYATQSLDDPMLQGMVMEAGDGSNVEIQELGRETRDGLDLTKYQLTGTDSDGGEIGGVYWQTDDGIIVEANGHQVTGGQRMEGHIVLSNIVFGPQDPALFEPPAGPAVDSGAAEGGGQDAIKQMMIDAMKRQGLSDAQIEQMLQQLQKLNQ